MTQIGETLGAASFARARLDAVTAKLFSLALALAGVEVFINGFGQLELLSPVFGPIGLAISLASHLAATIAPWMTRSFQWAFSLHALVTLVLTLAWPLQVETPGALPAAFQPWLWWVLGPAAIAAGLAMNKFQASAVILVIPLVWLWMHQTSWGGSASFLRSFQDATYVFLFSATFTLVLLLLREQAKKTDEAARDRANAEVKRATADATERERSRVGALIHDRVLTALVVAANAKSPEQIVAAKASAKAAIEALTNTTVDQPDETESHTTVFALFGALSDAFANAEFEVSVSGNSDLRLPIEVAKAFNEAVVQATTNSLQHAGENVKRELVLRGRKSGFKIVVKDDGRGFRPSRVPKTRLGIRLSIIDRIEAVGGRAFIDSSPGQGCSIVLSWEQN